MDTVWLDVARYDPVTQMLDESHVALTPDGVRLFPIVPRHIWPAEMDLMARIAGLRLKERWGDWDPPRIHPGQQERHLRVRAVR